MNKLFSPSLLPGLSLMASSIAMPLRADNAYGPALHVAMQGNNLILSWPATNNAFGVQYSTNLNSSTWTTLPNVTIVSNNYVATDLAGDSARFYRLISPCGEIAPPTLGPIASQNITSTRYITLNGDPIVDPHIPSAVDGGGTTVLDASAFIDPSSCVPVPLNYHWVVTYIRSSDGAEFTPYTDAGITGYLNPVLKITKDAMPPGDGYITLTVTSQLHPEQSTTTRTNIEIDQNTRLQLDYYLSCRATGVLCNRQDPDCLCFIAAALPTTEPF